MINIAVYLPDGLPESFLVYSRNIVKRLPDFDIIPIEFSEQQRVPEEADVLWDPRAGGGNAPPTGFSRCGAPLVVTLHGASPFAVPLTEQSNSIIELIHLARSNWTKRLRWLTIRHHCASIITVSQYAKEEIAKSLWLPSEIIVPIFHGVDTEIFRVDGVRTPRDPYFFHVSRFQKKKNFTRICEAYDSLPLEEKPKLIAVIPGFDGSEVPEGIEMIAESLDQASIATYLRGALGLVFPSLHETFGLPIIEAMACGCPVITSNTTACKEIAGEDAILVDPRSVSSIRDGMERLVTDSDTRARLRERGLKKSRLFTWERSAEIHAGIFQAAFCGV